MVIGAFCRLEEINVLLVGDLILDSYIYGKAQRISPEAPVPVLLVDGREQRPGGAGNVALNLVSLGAKVTLWGRIGDDDAGRQLQNALQEEGIDCQDWIVSHSTPIKTRFIANNQQLIRVDDEKEHPLTPAEEDLWINQLERVLEGKQLVAISDYGKGVLTTRFLRHLIQAARAKNIPILADPKGSDFTRYEGVTLLKPNLGEARAAANCQDLEGVAKKLLIYADVLMVTRSEEGISLFFKDGTSSHHPVRVREIKDVTGAGDTVLAMLAVALANRLSYTEAADLCNAAASVAIETLGCARVTLSDLAKRLLETDNRNKVFDTTHLAVLRRALDQQMPTHLELTETQLTSELFNRFEQAPKPLIVELSGTPNPHWVRLLANLQSVNYVIIPKI